MLLLLFFICSTLALSFIIISQKSKKHRVKHRFFIYGLIFSSLAIGTTLINLKHYGPVIKEKIYFAIEKPELIGPPKIQTSSNQIGGGIKLDAPLIKQLPELPRGCEITSLAMLLAYNEIDVDKMDLAKQIKKNPAQFKRVGHKIYFGNPHNGFVGDMLSLHTPGLGVYNEPIEELLAQHIDKKRINNFSGQDFTEIIKQLNHKRPVWVIINGQYDKLPKSAFVTWHTENGPIEITMREHSVLITGYDKDYIYFNDPLDRTTKAPIKNFQLAWEQMGKQAITILE